MTGTLRIFSRGLWQLRPELAALSGRQPRRPAVIPGADCAVAGWGHKPTAAMARRYAKLFGLPYIAFEDGFLRSLHAGAGQRPSAMVMDGSGIYYDAHGPSDLERMLQLGDFSDAMLTEAEALLEQIRRQRLSKYNDSEDRVPEALTTRRPLVLLIDQTFGDQSVAGGMADGASFERMAAAAVDDNPGALIAVKLHPEVLSGRKQGYLRDVALRRNLPIVSGNVNPHALFDLGPKVYTVSSQFGFEAVLAGCDVSCFGLPFYAGWGLTLDHMTTARRTRQVTRRELAAAAYLGYSRYFDCWTRKPIDAATAADQLHFLRQRFLGNDRKLIAYRIPRWKQRAIAAMADGPAGPPAFHRNLDAAMAEARRLSGVIGAWGQTAARLRQDARLSGIGVVAIEDGFLRSAGLGSAFVQPRSLVFDHGGIHYDPRSNSDLTRLIADGDFTSGELRRAGKVIAAVSALGITKYNLGGHAVLPNVPAGRERVLVIGQVDDDQAVAAARYLLPDPHCNVNQWLLARARQLHPAAFVIFKPHPDVVRMGRAGALTADIEDKLADMVVADMAIADLLPQVSQVVTFGSLTGFEALLRGVAVETHGFPFYAGWGLSDDRNGAARRGQTRKLSELAAAVLIRYPRYWDPDSNLACPVETVIERLADEQHRRPRLSARALAQAGRVVAIWRRLRNAAIRSGNATRQGN